MDKSELYSQLYGTLESEAGAFVVSKYLVDGSIESKLVCAGDAEQYAEVDALLQDPHATHNGPLTTVQGADGSLVVVECFMAMPRLIILGGGHISLALADLAHLCDFDTVVYDDRPSFANSQRFKTARSVICDSFANLRRHISFCPSDFVVDVTRGHLHDKECLEAVLSGVEPAYTGMIGSKRRIAIVFDQLKDEGFDAERISRICAPIGLGIGAVTPAEIAISIMAQVIEAKRMNKEGKGWVSADLEMVEGIARRGFSPDAFITVLATEGSAPTEVGCKLAMTFEGSMVGTVGGGCSEAEALRTGREVISKGGWRLLSVDLTDDSAEDEGMVCGGTIHLLVEKAC